MSRKAQLSDIDELERMAREYHAWAAPVWPYSEDGFRSLMAALIESPDGFVRIGGGFIAGHKYRNPLSPDWLIAGELMWWSKGNGLALFRAFREWASDANEIKYSCPATEAKVRRFFKRYGPLSEVVYSEVRPCV